MESVAVNNYFVLCYRAEEWLLCITCRQWFFAGTCVPVAGMALKYYICPTCETGANNEVGGNFDGSNE